MNVNHINYPDDNNQIYCKKQNSIITLDPKGKFWKTCFNCKFFNGSYQGNGVECLYPDSPSPTPSIYYDDPSFALSQQNQKV